jgi:hypothetical protein
MRRILKPVAVPIARRAAIDLARARLLEISEATYGLRPPSEVGDLVSLRAAVVFGDLTEEVASSVHNMEQRLPSRPELQGLALRLATEVANDRQLANVLVAATTALDDVVLDLSTLIQLVEFDVGMLARLDRAAYNAGRLPDLQLLQPRNAAVIARLAGDLQAARLAFERANLESSLGDRLLSAAQLHCLGEPEALLGVVDRLDGPGDVLREGYEVGDAIGLLYVCGVVCSRFGDRNAGINYLEAAWRLVGSEVDRVVMPSNGAAVALELARAYRLVGREPERRQRCLERAVDEFCRARLAIDDVVERHLLEGKDVTLDTLLTETLATDPTLTWLVIETFLQNGLADVLRDAGWSSVTAAPDMRDRFRRAWTASRPELAALQHGLPRSTALLVLHPFVVHCPGEYCGIALVVDRDSVRGWRFGLVDSLAEFVSSGEVVDYAGMPERTFDELGRHLLPQEWLGGSPPERVVIVASDALARVPLHAAHLNDGRRLVEVAEVTWSPSAAIWSLLDPVSTRWTEIVVLDGGMKYGSELVRDLAASGAHVRVVRTLEELDGSLRDTPADVVIVWSHGTQPTNSDDRRNVLRIGGTEVDALELAQCRLPAVVISPACWSGALVGEGDISPWSFLPIALIAGAHAVMMTMWAVPIASTAALVVEVVRRGRAGASNPGRALAVAQADWTSRPIPSWAGVFGVCR